MKGLIIKDIMCLKKQLKLLGFVTIGVFAVSVMFVISARCGNIALAGRSIVEDSLASDIDVKNLSTYALMFFMLLPIAAIGDIANVFEADGKAGFTKVACILPLSIEKRLLARYITIFSMFGLGVVLDIVIALVLSVLTDIISFSDFLGIIISMGAVMSIENALFIVLCIALGYGKEDYARIISWIIGVGTVIAINFSKLKTAFITDDFGIMNDLMEFIKHRSYILLGIAALVVVVSYAMALMLAKRERGRV